MRRLGKVIPCHYHFLSHQTVPSQHTNSLVCSSQDFRSDAKIQLNYYSSINMAKTLVVLKQSRGRTILCCLEKMHLPRYAKEDFFPHRIFAITRSWRRGKVTLSLRCWYKIVSLHFTSRVDNAMLQGACICAYFQFASNLHNKRNSSQKDCSSAKGFQLQ